MRWKLPKPRALLHEAFRLSLSRKVIAAALVMSLPLTASNKYCSTQNLYESISRHFAPWPFWVLDLLINISVIVIGLALILYAFACVRRALPSGARSSPEEKAILGPSHLLLNDAPIGSASTDEFERGPFVKTILKTVVLPERAASFVLALDSPWGSGKSSVLSILVRELESHDDKPLVIQFNPWITSGSDRIFRSFFSQFCASLLDEDERALAEKLASFAETIEDLLPENARVASRVAFIDVRRRLGRIPIADLERQRSDIGEAVTRVGRPIVVIIDDVDRLTPDDIRVVFQLVKAVAAFPRVSYVLAFDPGPIDLALSSDGQAETGRAFREKVVQASIGVPRVRFARRKEFFTRTLDEKIDHWGLALDGHERLALQHATPIVLSALVTPRDIKRAINKTLIASDNVRREVNFTDILVVETVHTKYPAVIDAIRRNPRLVGL